jgi:hypothetical protein
MRDWLNPAIIVLSVLGLLLAGCGSIALLQLSAIWDGTYDPVRADGFAPEDVPRLKRRLGRISLASAAIAALSLAGLWIAAQRSHRNGT